VELLRLALAIANGSGLVLVSDGCGLLVEERLHQAMCDTRLRSAVVRENAVCGRPSHQDAAA
jgi:hypothetical protein